MVLCRQTVPSMSNNDFKHSLTQLQASVDCRPGTGSTMIIHRSRLLQSTLAAIRRPNFSFSHQIAVEFVGEEAEDYGGPRREYLRSV